MKICQNLLKGNIVFLIVAEFCFIVFGLGDEEEEFQDLRFVKYQVNVLVEMTKFGL